VALVAAVNGTARMKKIILPITILRASSILLLTVVKILISPARGIEILNYKIEPQELLEMYFQDTSLPMGRGGKCSLNA